MYTLPTLLLSEPEMQSSHYFVLLNVTLINIYIILTNKYKQFNLTSP